MPRLLSRRVIDPIFRLYNGSLCASRNCGSTGIINKQNWRHLQNSYREGVHHYLVISLDLTQLSLLHSKPCGCRWTFQQDGIWVPAGRDCQVVSGNRRSLRFRGWYWNVAARLLRLDVRKCAFINGVINNWNSSSAHYVNCCTLKYISRAGIGNCKIIRRVDSERYMANSLCLLMPELQHKTLMESGDSVDASIRRGHGRGTLRSLKTARWWWWWWWWWW